MLRPVVRAVVLALAVATGTLGFAEENRSKFNKVLGPGDAAPVFEKLPGADGKTHSLADYKDSKVVVVCFTSTLCSVVDIYEDRLAAFAKEYKAKGVTFVAISCERRGLDSDGNAGEILDPANTGELDRIKQRVVKNGLPFEYLYDGSQQLGRAYGARCTPSLFVLDGERKIAYLGAFDDSFPADGVMEHYVRDAVDAVLAGKSPDVKESLARGCRLDFAAAAE